MKVDVSKWALKTLGDVCTFKRGLTYPKSEESAVITSNVVLRSNNIDLNTCALVFNELKYLSDSYTISNEKKLVKGSILMCMSNGSSAHIGKVAYIDNDYDYAFGGFMGLIIPKDINPKFLYYKYRSESFKTFLWKIGNGINITNLKFSSISPLPIYLPTQEEQDVIVKELDTLQIMIDGYKAQITDLTELAKSLFLDMFGDPIINDKGWEKKLLSKVGNFARGVSTHRPRNAPELLGGIMPLIQTGDIANAGMYITKYSKTYSELGVKQSKVWSAGTLCITIAANIGKCSILKFEACFPDSVVGYIPNNNFVYNEYLFYVFERLQSIMEANAPGVAQKNINLAYLNSLLVPLPPIELQKEFISKINCIEKQKELLREQLTDAEQLMAERMQYYFS